MTPRSPHREGSRTGDDIEELRRLSDLLQTPRPYPSAAEQTEDDWIALQALDDALAGQLSSVLSGARIDVAAVREVQEDLRRHPEYAHVGGDQYDLLLRTCALLVASAGRHRGVPLHARRDGNLTDDPAE